MCIAVCEFAIYYLSIHLPSFQLEIEILSCYVTVLGGALYDDFIIDLWV